MRPIKSLIVAHDLNRVIGMKGQLPWNLPVDLKYFRDKTRGHPVIMGRSTFDSLGKPLPGRMNIVLTRDVNLKISGCTVVGDLQEGFRLAAGAPGGAEEIFVIGGGQIYALALPFLDRLYITLIHGRHPGDAYFPEYNPKLWKLVSEDRRRKDENHAYDYDFLIFERDKA